MLERLSPEERAALILHDAFDRDYAEIAATLGKNEAACRKLVSRARERVKADRPRYTVSAERHRDVVARFAQAAQHCDATALAGLLADDVVFYADGGGRVAAVLNPVFGADKVSRLIAGLVRKFHEVPSPRMAVMEINGSPGFVMSVDGEIASAMTLTVAEERIIGIHAVRNPEKLARLARALGIGRPGTGVGARHASPDHPVART